MNATYLDEPVARPRRRTRPQSRSGSGWKLVLILGGVAAAGLVVLVAAALIAVALMPNQHGEKLALKNGSELYYTKTVTAEEATRFADFLNNDEMGLVKLGATATFQLNKSGDRFEVRYVVKPGSEDRPEVIVVCQAWARIASRKVFGGAPVDVHLCDDQLRTVKVIDYPTGASR